MKKIGLLSLIAVMGLFLSFCAKAATPTNGSEGGVLDLKVVCQQIPQSDMCVEFSKRTEMTPEKAQIYFHISHKKGQKMLALSYKDMSQYNSVVEFSRGNGVSISVSLRAITTDNPDLVGVRHTIGFYPLETGKNADVFNGVDNPIKEEGAAPISGTVMYMNYQSFYNKIGLISLFFTKDGVDYYVNSPQFIIVD